MNLNNRPAAFRLVNELEGLLRGATADRIIVADEIARIRRWLSEAQPYRHVHPFSDIAAHLEVALADGAMTLEECEDLLFVATNLTSHNPYYDQLRSGVQQLMGLLAGVSADRRVTADEALYLNAWATDWAHLTGLWPFDECVSLVTTMLRTQQWNDAPRQLLRLSDEFPVAGHLDVDTGELPPLLLSGVCAVDPIIEFKQKRFVFTGASSRCERTTFHGLVEDRGGHALKNVGASTNYLIVCDEGSPYWAFSCYGRKVETAYGLRRAGTPIVIAHETSFWRTIA